jgi:hypothetical protein
MDLNCVENQKIVLKSTNKSRILTIGRTNLTVPHKGRGSCQYRDLVAVPIWRLF